MEMYQTGTGKHGRDSPATTLQWGVSGLLDMGGHGRWSDKGSVGSDTLQLLAL